MGWKKKKVSAPTGTKEHHLLVIKQVAQRYPDFEGTTRWALEVAFIDAALLYEQGTDHDMPDNVWDALGAYLAKTWNKRSAFFKYSVNRSVLRKKPTNLAINWNCGLGRAAVLFWANEPKPERKRVKLPKRPTKVPTAPKKKLKRRIAAHRKPG